MARNEDIEPTGAARRLKGLADDLAVMLRQRAAEFLAKAAEASADAGEIDKTMRTIAAIARAGVAVQNLQAAEDKADGRALDRHVAQAASAMRALHFIHDEGDETDMNETDPRLDDPQRMAAADKELVRRLDALALEIKAGSLPGKPARRPAPAGAGQLDDAEPPTPTPAH